jgi:rSAM/selenodomain-associated transferase 1
MTARHALIVFAKAPVAARAKTRLCPPLRPAQAAQLAQAALHDTLLAVAATPAARRVLVLDGEPGAWLPHAIEVVPQGRGGFAARLASAFADVGEAALLIGMDTPQVTPRVLAACLERLDSPGTDAVLGRSFDGGYWAIGLREPDSRVFSGVPMSTERTAALQRGRLDELGLRTATLQRLRDVDRFADALAVARDAPHTHFARMLTSILAELSGDGPAPSPRRDVEAR